MEKVLFNATLVFAEDKDGKILLGMKTRKIGAGCWNGYGGGIESGETPEQSALRELEEECNLTGTPENLEKCAEITFHNTKEDGTQFDCIMHTYFLKNVEGEVKETEEMATPTWFAKNELPYDTMMPADRDWIPHIMKGKKIKAKAWYGPYQKVLLKPTEIKIVKELVL